MDKCCMVVFYNNGKGNGPVPSIDRIIHNLLTDNDLQYCIPIRAPVASAHFFDRICVGLVMGNTPDAAVTPESH